MDWAEEIDRVTSGYRNAALVIFGVKTGIFEALGAEDRTAAEVAAERGLDRRATEVVMCALVAAGFLTMEGDRFRLPAGAEPYLLRSGECSMASIIGHNRSLLQKWARLDEVLRDGRPTPREERTEEEMRDFILGMENVSRRSSEEVARAVDLAGCRRLLDLGGGPGTAALAFARAHPDLECVVFDLPGPVGIAEEQIRAAGLTDRVATAAGDFLTDPLGSSYDVVYISNILHMLGPEDCVDLLRRAVAALTDDGRILIKDFYLDDSRTHPAFAAQFSVNMLVATEAGRSYTHDEMDRMLGEAGLRRGHSWSVAVHSTVIEAKRES